MEQFTGVYTAIVTPFKDGLFDEDAFEGLLQRQIEAGVDGIVPVGTTGESPTLNFNEHVHVIKRTVDYVRTFGKGKIKVLAGTGANCTAEAIELTLAAKDMGADGSLQVTPYYNKPTQEGLYQHFGTIAKKTKLPIVLYSVPSRCGVAIAVDTVSRLANSFDNIVGIKEAGGDPRRTLQILAATNKLSPNFTVLSGDDDLTLDFMELGAKGVISVASNIIPAQMCEMVKNHGDNFCHGATSVSEELHQKYHPLFKALFLESNPIPVKAALGMMGLIQNELRLPMTPMNMTSQMKLAEVMRDCGVLTDDQFKKSLPQPVTGATSPDDVNYRMVIEE